MLLYWFKLTKLYLSCIAAPIYYFYKYNDNYVNGSMYNLWDTQPSLYVLCCVYISVSLSLRISRSKHMLLIIEVDYLNYCGTVQTEDEGQLIHHIWMKITAVHHLVGREIHLTSQLASTVFGIGCV